MYKLYRIYSDIIGLMQTSIIALLSTTKKVLLIHQESNHKKRNSLKKKTGTDRSITMGDFMRQLLKLNNEWYIIISSSSKKMR